MEDLTHWIKEKFLDEGTGHDWFHIQRVHKLAKYIQQQEGGDAIIIQLAALLHDISDHKFNGGDFEKGGSVAHQVLKDKGFENDTCLAVEEIVRNISYKGSGEKDYMPSREGKIVQDADRLDAIGAIGIARTFAYGGSIQQPIYDPNIPPKTQQTKESYTQDRTHTINHFYEKLLLLKDRMHTATGRKLADERTKYMQAFLTQFYKEWEGDLK